MASHDERVPEELTGARISPPNHLDSPHLHGLSITKTADGVIISFRVQWTDRRDVLRRIEEMLSEVGDEAIEHFGNDSVKAPRSDSLPSDTARDSADTACQDQDVLNWDNLIPVAPDRPCGRIQVRLKKARRDKPAPADDPWAK